MPSRLRYHIVRPNGQPLFGREALALIKQTTAAAKNLWPKVSWAAIDSEGQKRHLWTQLQVFRERRGLANRRSHFFHVSQRHSIEPLKVRLARSHRRDSAQRIRQAVQVAGQRRGLNSLARAVLAPGEVPEPPNRQVRPGIFA